MIPPYYPTRRYNPAIQNRRSSKGEPYFIGYFVISVLCQPDARPHQN